LEAVWIVVERITSLLRKRSLYEGARGHAGVCRVAANLKLCRRAGLG
jgi:hypothetical protein